jgi:hypothetical protein
MHGYTELKLLGEKTMKTLVRLCIFLAQIATLAWTSETHADVVTDWNEIAVATVIGSGTTAPMASRNMAIVQVSVFEAANAITRTRRPYRLQLEASPGTSMPAAIASAAHEALVLLYPAKKPDLDKHLAADLARIADGTAKDAGIALGQRAARGILAHREGDGSTAQRSYTSRNQPGYWTPAPNVPPLAPHWASVKPWTLADVTALRPAAPPAIDSERQLRDYDEVRAIGSKTSTSRTDEQTSIARLWILPGVPTWNPMLRQMLLAKAWPMHENARAFALLAMASADAIIACWDTKYTYEGWRPVNAIRLGGIAGRTPDPEWESAVPTPPFPGYVSGHACFGGAAQGVLESVFGGDDIPPVTLATSSAPGFSRTYSKLSSIVAEASNARIWGGIHWRTDQEVGEELGRKVGRHVAATQLLPARLAAN